MNATTFNLDIPLPCISSAAVLAELSIGAWNPTRLDRLTTDEVHIYKRASANSGKYVKFLFPDVAQFAQVKTVEMRGRHWHRRMSVPFSDSGQRLLVTAMLPDYVEGMTKIEHDFWAVVQDIENNYDSILRHCQAALGDTFDASLYPAAHEIHRQFKFHHARLPVPETNDFDRIAGSAQTIMKEEFGKHMQRVQENIIADMGASTREVLQRMSERLDFGGEGDKKIFRNSLVENVREWTDRMGKFNEVLKIQQVDHVRGQINDLLGACNAEVLRENADVRKQVKQKVDGILSAMNW
jgi:hypothetical protein